MKTLITYAVEAEFAPWRGQCDMRDILVGETIVHRAQIGTATIDFVATGIGPANARRVAESVISLDYTFCVSSGFAGALRESCQLGDVLVAQHVQQDTESRTMECARDLVAQAERDGAKRIEKLLTVDHLVATAAEKSRLAPFAEAVDMESYAILSVAQEKKLPAVAIRVISDSFDRDLPVEIDTLVNEAGNVKIAGVVRYLARHPLVMPALLRLGRQSKTAAQSLANFLEAYVKKMCFATPGWPPPELQEVSAP